jgi:hypothetical protein
LEKVLFNAALISLVVGVNDADMMPLNIFSLSMQQLHEPVALSINICRLKQASVQ